MVVIITGTQRSGTTFLTGCFKEEGFKIGSGLFHKDIEGGYESDYMMRWIQSKIPGFPFTGYAIPKKSPLTEVNKASWLMMIPEYIPIFLKEHPEEKFKWIIMQRDFQDVIDSKASHKRFDLDHKRLKQSKEEMALNFAEGLELLSFYNQDYVTVDFEHLLTESYRLDSFLNHPISETIIKNYNPKKIKRWKKP